MVKLIFVILSVALIVNSIIAKANEKDIKKTNKFNIGEEILSFFYFFSSSRGSHITNFMNF